MSSSAQQTIPLGDLMPGRGESIDPANHPGEIFDLYSIPAFDRREPELLRGSEIGSTKQSVQPGDVMISKIVPHIRRAWQVGPSRGHRMIASSEWIVLRDARIDPGYMKHQLVEDRFHAKFMQTVSGVGGSLLRARPAHVAKIEILLPPIAEQRRIAVVLDKADELRAKRRTALADLDILTKSIFLEMFGDPARNTRNYPTARLGDLGHWSSGGTPPRSKTAYFKGEIPWLSSGELNAMFVRESKEHISREALSETSAKPVRQGSLLLGMYDTAALKASIAGIDCSCNQAIAFAELDEKRAATVYVYFAIVVGREHFRRLQRGVRQKNLNLSMVREIRIPVPPIGEQRRFCRAISAIGKLREKQEIALQEQDNLFHCVEGQLLG